MRYDRLLIATGARPRTIPALDGRSNVQVLRTLDDAIALRGALHPGAQLAIVGAGLIGQEAAAAARAAGADATLIDAARAPFGALVGPALAPWLAALQRDAGVRLRLGARLDAVEGGERVEALVLAGGERIACDHVLVGVGVVPETESAAARTSRGCRASSPPATSCVPVTGRRRRGRGRTPPARSSASRRAPEALPLVWSDQHGVRIQRIGELHSAERAELDGDLAAHDFTVTYHRGGRPVAAVAGRASRRPARRPPAARRNRPREERRMTYLPQIDTAACVAHGDCVAVAPQRLRAR